ncbi:MAG: ETC complex I subunit [Bdellovibrionales bacterium]
MKVRIYQPAKTAMQSGRAKAQKWLVEPELATPRTPDPLMGWASAGDTMVELLGKLKFATAEEAVAFAKEKGWEYSVTAAQHRRIEPKNYLDNFKYVPAKETSKA